MSAAIHGLRVTLSWNIDKSTAPRVHIRPGGYTNDPEKACLQVGSRTVVVYLTGAPRDLRTWAEQVLVLADELADSDDGSEVTGDA